MKRIDISTNLFISVSLLIIIFTADMLIPLGPSIGALYLIPVVILSRSTNRNLIGISVVASLFMAIKVLWYHDKPIIDIEIVLFNRLVSLLSIWTVTWLMIKYKKSIERKDEMQLQFNAYIKSVFNNTRIAFCVIDRSWIVVAINDLAIQMGISLAGRAPIQGMSFMDYVSESRRNHLIKMMEDCLNGKVIEYETSYNTNGKQLYFASTMMPVFDNYGNITAVSIATHEVTKLKEAELDLKQHIDELGRSNKELEQFAYIASHDLQEPLRMVASYVQLLERRYKDKLDSDASEFIGYAVDGANRMKQLINDLLMYSRVGRGFEEITTVDLNSAVEQALKNLESSVKETMAVIKKEQLPVINAAPVEMVQIFQNLVGNAIKFRRDGVAPEITIGTKDENTHGLFFVKDNGIGIEQEYSDKIFIIFKRLNDKTKYQGTGIGLAIAKKIVERYNGKIWFESEPGKGSTFYFTLSKHQGNTAPNERKQIKNTKQAV